MKKEAIRCGFIKGSIIFFNTFLDFDNLPASIKFILMFFSPNEIMNIAIGKKDKVRKKIRKAGLYTSIWIF
jgi:hypothetical protein